MRGKWGNRWLIAVLVLLVSVAFSGCQAIGGLDVSKALSQAWTTPSYEGEQSIMVEFGNDGSAKPPGKDSLDWSVLDKARISITNWKKQDNDHSSFDGQLTYGKGNIIAFKGSVNKGSLALQVDGASDPIVFSISSFLGDRSAVSDSPFSFDIGSLLSNAGIADLLVPFIITNMPNPSAVSVTPVTETVHGESLQLQKLHMELKGSELNGMIGKLFDNLLGDEKALKELLRQVVKVMYPPSENGLDISGFAADLALGSVKELLTKYRDISQLGSWTAGVLDPKTTLKADIYIDGSSNVRKTGWELALSLPNMAGSNQIKLSGASALWNLNKPVQAAMIETTENAFHWGEKDSKLPNLVRKLDSKSTLYNLLMNGLHVTRKSVIMEMTDNTGGDENNPKPYINGDDKTMVPVRFVSEKLDASVEWNGDTQEVTITDAWTGTKLVLQIGSGTAQLNGSSVEVGTKVELTNSTTYVPIRFIAETFGADVGFQQQDGVSVVTIVKP